MRASFVLLAFVSATSVTAQIPAPGTGPNAAQTASQMAIQQAQLDNQRAMQASQEANQRAMAASDEASRQAMDANRRASENAQANTALCYVAAPKLSMKPGSYSAPVTLRLKDSTRGTAIYYTTDGWTPTTESTRYTGPITLSSTATLQAIAVDAHDNRSNVLSAAFTISGSQPEKLDTDLPGNYGGAPVLMPGTVLPLVFSAAVSSRNVEVGDRLPVVLAQDLKAGGELLAAKGTPVVAKVTQVDASGRMGLPGTLSFAVSAITLKDGTTLQLAGGETKDGRPRQGRAAAATLLVPFVPAGVFVRGDNAEIPAGATLAAKVAATNRASVSSDAAPDWFSSKP